MIKFNYETKNRPNHSNFMGPNRFRPPMKKTTQTQVTQHRTESKNIYNNQMKLFNQCVRVKTLIFYFRN